MAQTYDERIIVRMFHGSCPKFYKKQVEKIAEPGGYFGGHVALQIEDKVYGFYYKELKKLTLFPKKENLNSYIQIQSISEWEQSIQYRQESCFHIPFEPHELTQLRTYYERISLFPEEDYSFFGERCASHVYKILQRFNKVQKGNYFLHAFWPGAFWKTLCSVSKKKGYMISVKKGSECRRWQGNINTFPPHPWSHLHANDPQI
jgi:hypothetical protein